MNRLIYFSATGNTRNLAMRLKELLPERGFEAHSVKESAHFERGDFTLFLLPVYNGGVADIMKRYIKSLDGKGSKAAALCTYGGVCPGKALPNALVILRDRGFEAVGGATVPMPHSYSGPLLEAGFFPDDDMIKKIAAFILNCGNGNFSYQIEKSAPLKRSFSPSQRLLGRLTCRIEAYGSKCSGCGSCAEACPVSAITIPLKIYNKQCIRCAACVRKCPEGALSLKFLTKIPVRFMTRLAKKPRKAAFYLVCKNRICKISY